tara:strand:- start:68826 stop:69575 length:750 start_codon:yes stop_codon:yes gene_type:complete
MKDYEALISELKENKDLEKFKANLNNTNYHFFILTSAIMDEIESNKDKELFEKALMIAIAFEDKKENKYIKYVNRAKSISDLESQEFKSTLYFLGSSVFSNQYMRKYESFYIVNLLKENLKPEAYKKAEDIIFKERNELMVEMFKYNNLKEYPNPTLAYNYSLKNHFNELLGTVYEEKAMKETLGVLKNQLIGMEIKHSDHFFTVSDVAVEKSKYKKDEVLLKVKVKSNSSDRMIEVEVDAIKEWVFHF